MADRTDYYFRQRVTETELDLGFELLETADRDLAADIGVVGIVSGAVPAPHAPVANLSVDLDGPARAYDRLGQRIFFGTGQVVDCSVDHTGIPTEVVQACHERWLGVVLRFDRLLSDPRTDGNSQQVFFRRDESFQLLVRQAPEGPAGAGPGVPLVADELLVCDVRRTAGQTQILVADLDLGRRQAFVFADAQTIEVLIGAWTVLQPSSGTVQAALDATDQELEAHFSGTGRRHGAGAIDCAAPGWLSGTDLQAALDSLVSGLTSTAGGSAGASRVGADAAPGTPHALPAGTVDGQLSQLLAWLNAHEGASSGAHPSSAIAYPGGPDWRGGRTNPATSVGAQLTKIVSDLGEVAAGDDGAERIGAQAVAGSPLALPAGSVREQLDLILARANRAGMLDEVNTWQKTQTLLGAPGVRFADPGGSLLLLAELPSTDLPARVYSDGTDLWITINAERVGVNWKANNTAKPRSALRLTAGGPDFLYQGATPGTWTSWARAVSLTLGGTNVELVSIGASGIQQRSYTGAEGYHSGSSSLGGSWNYPLRFASAPSSVTFLQTSRWPSSWSTAPTLWQHDETGGSWFGTPGGGSVTAGTAWYTAKVTAY
ncbi:MAG: hypothetical protein RBU30_23510 [Polyangia bacterium]|nr:hypothetical protein [Polyangia bacterium]